MLEGWADKQEMGAWEEGWMSKWTERQVGRERCMDGCVNR